MGFAISWVAVKGKAPDTVREELSLTSTDEVTDLAFHPPVSAASLPTGWYVIAANSTDHKLTRNNVVSKLSNGCEVVAVVVEEHVMWASAVGWRHREKLWEVMHYAERGMFDLETTGTVPEAFERIRDSAFAQQRAENEERAEVDYVFDVPVDLAEEITGFRHDGTDAEFVVLERDRRATRRRWFRR
jgi:hypothetical protein